MSFWTIFLCVLTFVAVSLVVGWGWFSVCGWDELFNCRNYKPLVFVIPITFALAFLLVGFPVRTEIKTAEVAPQPKVEKITKKRKKPKKETATQTELPSEETPRDSNDQEGDQ